MSKRWVQWWLVLAGLILSGTLLTGLLLGQGAVTAGQIVLWVFQALTTGWLAYGLWSWRKRRWVRWTTLVILGTYLVAGLTLWWWQVGWYSSAMAITGIWVLMVSTTLGLYLVWILLSPGHPITGVARTVLAEALGERVGLAFMVILLILLPVLPLLLNPNELLNYRIKTFLTWSIGGVGVVLSVLTLLLSCWTICKEISNRQIFLSLTKPVSRGQYLAGKWLGIMLMNSLLLLVAGLGIWLYARVLSYQPARDMSDRLAVNEQVLVARVSSSPRPTQDTNMTQLFEERLKQLQAEDPSHWGSSDTPKELSDKDRQTIQNQVLARWLTIPPQEGKVYRFTGLEPAMQKGLAVQMRFKPQASKVSLDEMVKLAFAINGRAYPADIDGSPRQVEVSNGHFHILNIPTQLISPQGELVIAIVNINLMNRDATFPASISFAPNEGLEVLYRVGGFEANLVKGLAIIWMQLAFLAALGLLAGTFLSFPVACLFSGVAYLIVLTSGFLEESLQYYVNVPRPTDTSAWGWMAWVTQTLIDKLSQGELWDAIKIVIKVIGEIVVFLSPSFDDFSVGPALADGRWISYAQLWTGCWQLLLVFTLGCGLVGYWIFRKRELASASA